MDHDDIIQVGKTVLMQLHVCPEVVFTQQASILGFGQT